MMTEDDVSCKQSPTTSPHAGNASGEPFEFQLLCDILKRLSRARELNR